jgi:hypothetical protein
LGLENINACPFGAEIGFQADEDQRCVWAEVKNLGIPLDIVSCKVLARLENGVTCLIHYVLERVRAVDGEADKEKISLWVGQRTQTIIFFLSSCIPES